MVVPDGEPRASEWYQALDDLAEAGHLDPWKPPPVEVVAPIDGEAALRAQMPWYSDHVLVLRDEAIDSVGPLLEPHGWVLPLAGKNARLAVFATPLLDDALIEDQSELHRNFSWDEFPRLIHGIFEREVVGDLKAFTIRLGRAPWLVLRESLVRDIEATGHTVGVSFRPVGFIGSATD